MHDLSPGQISDKPKATILVVDDTPDNLKLISAVLKDSYKLRVCTGGRKALTLAATHPLPDLILLDVMMPEMDGYEVCQRLKADPATRNIPIIFLTARTEDGDEQKGLRLGAVDYIGKPIDPQMLLRRVASQITTGPPALDD